MTTRCEEVIVQVVMRTYDDANAPIAEQTSAPVKVFRNAQTVDFWGQVEKFVAATQAQAAKPMKRKGR